MANKMAVTVRDLGDYFMASPSHVFKCCGVNMILVTKRTVYEVVR